MKIQTHMVFLGTNPFDDEKPALESKRRLLNTRPGAVIQVNNGLYEVLRMRQKTTVKDGVELTMQFIYVKPTSKTNIYQKIQKVFQTN